MKKLLNKIKNIRKENKVYYTNLRKWNKENKTKGVVIFDNIVYVLMAIIVIMVCAFRVVEESHNLKIKNQLAESEVIEIKTRKEKSNARLTYNYYFGYYGGEYDEDNTEWEIESHAHNVNDYFKSGSLDTESLKNYYYSTYPATRTVHVAGVEYEYAINNNLYLSDTTYICNIGYNSNVQSVSASYLSYSSSSSYTSHVTITSGITILTNSDNSKQVVFNVPSNRYAYQFTINIVYYDNNIGFNLPSCQFSNYDYLNGYQTAESEYTNALTSMENQYNILSAQYSALASDYDILENDGINLNEMILTTAQAPFKIFKDIINFNVCGVNIWGLVTGLFSLILFIWLLKKVV